MDGKTECESGNTLCYGCLSADRKISYVTGPNKALFLKLRGEYKIEDVTKELLLCWECTALLNKIKSFQSRIQAAQFMIVRYLQNLYDKNEISLSLSTLKPVTTYHYNQDIIYNEENNRNKPTINSDSKLTDNKVKIDIDTDIETEKNQVTDIPETLLNEIKQEEIKIEYENFNDDIEVGFDTNTDFFDTIVKTENNKIKIKPKKKKKKSHPTQSLRKYKLYATVSDIHERFYDVRDAETVFLTEREMQEKLQVMQYKDGYSKMPFKCTDCHLSYRKKDFLLMHNTFHHTQPEYPTKCLYCRKEITSEEHKIEHWKSHCPMLKCTLCPELCISKGELLKHMNRTHTKVYKCTVCGQELSTPSTFAMHYRKAHEKMFCDHCNNGYYCKKRLENHIKNLHLPAHCPTCNIHFKRHKLLKHHNRMYHPELEKCDTKKELSYCVECDIQFPSVVKFKKHLNDSAKHNRRPKVSLPCPECNKIFSKKSYMTNHYRLFHLNRTNHYCEQCDKYYANGYGLRLHIKRIHQKIPPEKNKVCDICGRAFSNQRILDNHRRTHTGERPFQCKYCSATFAQETARKSHQKSQHENKVLRS